MRWSNPDACAVTAAVSSGALLVNAWEEPLMFRLPGDGPWSVEIDTDDPSCRRSSQTRSSSSGARSRS